eukprot:gene38259-47239_t
MDGSKSVEFKDELLGRDIRQLGRMLGDTIRAQHGDEAFNRIENVRQLAIRFRREQDAGAQAQLEDALHALSPDETSQLIRAFGYFSLLSNIAEDQHHSRRSRAHLLAGSAPRLGSLAKAVQNVVSAGRTEAFGDFFAEAHISPVFTAHPTEVQRKSTLNCQMAIARELDERDRVQMTPEEQEQNDEALARGIHTLWQTRLLRTAKLSVLDEVENGLSFFDRTILSGLPQLYSTLQDMLAKQGMEFKLGAKVTKAETTGAGVTLTVEPAKGGAAETLEADVVLVSIGRRPFVQGLGLDKVGVKMTERGRIAVDGHFQTSVPGIYAIGDVIDGPMLAHKASEDGVACVETLAGQKGHVNWDLVPSIIYTQPEVAWVGKTEEQLKAAGVAYKVGKYPFTADPRSRANGATEGFVKVLADKASDKVLGVHIFGAEAGTMIGEAAMAMEFSASAEDIGRVCHAHPTVNEALKEAALAAWDKPIHL